MLADTFCWCSQGQTAMARKSVEGPEEKERLEIG
jgi:hypothetical protein